MIRVTRCSSAAIERCVVKFPFWLGRFAKMKVLQNRAGYYRNRSDRAFGGEIILVPPLEFGLRRQRHLPAS